MIRDRRALFFLVAAVVAGLLYPVAEPAHRWIAAATSITYLVLAVASALDFWSRAWR